MAEERIQRRLAAILAADVVGYGRLMEADEVGTLAELKSRRKTVLEPLVARYQGRVFKVAGDGVLIEFKSAINAMQCAVELQRAMAAANTDLPTDRHVVLRVGVNLGDVVVEGSDLYGDGVNVAARLQHLAEPGNIWISRSVHDQVARKLSLVYDDLGEREIKNMEQRVHVFRIGGRTPIGPLRESGKSEKPSVAVLPFTNMSGKVEQQYFSDGVAEDIITELSRFHELSVIARNSSFQYRDKSDDVKRVAADLGVRFVVEGSVRRSADNVRITVQLIDARTASHLWAERFDRQLDEIFSIQDEVVQAIVANVAGRLEVAEIERVRRKPPANSAAYDWYLHGIEHRNSLSPEETNLARSWFKRALDLDPNYAAALAHLALLEANASLYERSEERFEHSLALANRAVALSPNDSLTHGMLGAVHLYGLSYHHGSHALAAQEIDAALRLNPNDPDHMVRRAVIHIYTGHPEAALPLLDQAALLNPILPNWYLANRGAAFYGLQHYADAAEAFERITSPAYWDHGYLAACYAQLGRAADARSRIAKALELAPHLTLKHVSDREWYSRQADLEQGAVHTWHNTEAPYCGEHGSYRGYNRRRVGIIVGKGHFGHLGW